MKRLLRKKIGSKRHREWAWAAVFIALATAGMAWWGSQELAPMQPGQMTNINASNIPGLTRSVNAPAATPADTSVAGVIAGLPDATAFNHYLVSTGVAAQLHGGSYTVFVPTNAAFAAAPKGSISGLSAAAQKRLVQYHVVAGKMLDSDAIISGTQQAMSNDTINFTVNLQTGTSYVGSGKVIRQYKASNGIVYLISAVLYPPR